MLEDYSNRYPEVHPDTFIGHGVYIMGKVRIAKGASIWYNTTLRGDINDIEIGENTNIQDNSVIHVADYDYKSIIGKDVTVGHNVIIHGCTIGDECLIGMGSIVMDGAQIGKNSMVGAGSLISPGKKYPPGTLILGSPAKVKRDLTEKEIEHIRESARRYIKIWKAYKEHGIPFYTSP